MYRLTSHSGPPLKGFCCISQDLRAEWWQRCVRAGQLFMATPPRGSGNSFEAKPDRLPLFPGSMRAMTLGEGREVKAIDDCLRGNVLPFGVPVKGTGTLLQLLLDPLLPSNPCCTAELRAPFLQRSPRLSRPTLQDVNGTKIACAKHAGATAFPPPRGLFVCCSGY